MRLAISNIAWDTAEDEAVARLLASHHIDAIDVAPGKYFPDPARASEQDITAVRAWWAGRGIEITGMQSLLFGATGLNMFGTDAAQAAMLDRLTAVCRVGAGLGAPRLVFGSPKNRDRGGLDDEEAAARAVRFFRRLGAIARDHGVTICLEPNPPRYGANFMTTSLETVEIVERVDHPAIEMQFDTGALTLQGEEAATVLARCAPRIGHIHASEPDLLPLGDGAAAHAPIAAAVRAFLPHHVVSIEMLATAGEPHLDSIERALKVASRFYRDAEMTCASATIHEPVILYP
jgi:sugar phosphate isomerase/epimerase